MGFPHVVSYRNVRLALGFHPQIASVSQSELRLFGKLVDKTSYVGEIGLDFSKNFISSKEQQISALRYILGVLRNKNKIISVHSRMAEMELLDLLIEHKIENVIFHWYSGPIKLIPLIIEQGYYFSINEAMTLSANGNKIISAIPKERILTESDAPYNRRCNIESAIKNIGITEGEVCRNFKNLLSKLK
jgi:TatD DNase family protein